MRYILPALLTVLVLGGCTGTSQKITPPAQNGKTAYPRWYITPVNNDSQYLYGTGSGEDMDTAVKNALVDISSKLSLSISSSSNIYKESYRDYREYTQKSVKEDIFAKTEELTFNNYEVIKSARLRYNSFAALVRVKKQTLAQNLKKQIDTLYKELDIQKKILSKKDPLTRYLQYSELMKRLSLEKAKVDILKTLEDEYNDKLFYNILNTMTQTLGKEKSDITFFIKSSSPVTQLSDILKQNITDKGFRVSFPNEANYTLLIKTEDNKNRTRGFYLIQNNITVEIYHKKSLLKSTLFKTKGASSTSFDDAQNDAIKDLKFLNIF